MEDLMAEADVYLLPLRKKNSLRPIPAYLTYLQASIRKIVETTGSLLESLLPKSIHAVTAQGFELKLALFVLACSINFLWEQLALITICLLFCALTMFGFVLCGR